MATIILNKDGKEIELPIHFSNEFKGKGGWNIKCVVSFEDEKKTFTTYTTNTRFFDNLSELRSSDPTWEEVQDFYKEEYLHILQDEIQEYFDLPEEEENIMTRESVIERLVNNEIDTIQQLVVQEDYSYLESIVRNGVTGFDNLCNEDLIEEYKQTFEETIKINSITH